MSDLIYIEDFISKEHEIKIIDYLDSKIWQNRKRRMQTYGYGYLKGDFNEPLHKLSEIPEIFHPILQVIGKEYNQLTVNEYIPGIGIEPHYDHKERFGEKIVGLSLISGCEMNFYDGKKIVYTKYLKQRSLYIMTGKWRYEYMHGIKGVCSDIVDGEKIMRTRRISLTFREIK
jgi:alkylated DNA repair protein alkB family protein 8